MNVHIGNMNMLVTIDNPERKFRQASWKRFDSFLQEVKLANEVIDELILEEKFRMQSWKRFKHFQRLVDLANEIMDEIILKKTIQKN